MPVCDVDRDCCGDKNSATTFDKISRIGQLFGGKWRILNYANSYMEDFNIDVVKHFANRQEHIEKELDAVRMELFIVKTISKNFFDFKFFI